MSIRRKKLSVRSQTLGNTLMQSWWWVDDTHAAEKCEAALAWETIRRTRSYQALWRKFSRETVPLLQQQGKPTLAGAFEHMHLLQRAREAVGQPYFDYMMKGFDPGSTWLELDEHQRLAARGFIFGNGGALKMNPEYLLAGQVADKRPDVTVGMVELGRDGSGNLGLVREIRGGFALRKVAHAAFFRKLPLAAPGHYVFVYFDTRGARDALLDAFDREMLEWRGTKSPASGVRLKANEQTVIPSEEPAFAIFVASARHNPATIRAAFHTQLKAALLKKWRRSCVDFWKTLTIVNHKFPRNPDGTKRIDLDDRGHPVRQKVVRHLFDPKKHLPPAKKPARSARRKDLWLGLAANDILRETRSLIVQSPEVKFLLKYTRSWDVQNARAVPYGRRCGKSMVELRNHQRSAAKRLNELDDAVGRLDKNLAHWNDQSVELRKRGFFKTAAGENPSEPE